MRIYLHLSHIKLHRFVLIFCLFSSLLIFVQFSYNNKKSNIGIENKSKSDHDVVSSDVYDGAFLRVDRYEPVNVTFLHVPANRSKTICSSTTKMLIVVVSRFSEFEIRKLIRKTWSRNRQSTSTSFLFLLGVDLDYYSHHLIENATETVQQSHGQHRNSSTSTHDLISELSIDNDDDDLILTDIVEHYHNLTLKTYAMMRYVQRYCPHVKCVVKSDSDTILNVPRLHQICEHSNAPKILGYCWPSQPNRNPASKWYVPTFVYPKPTFPPLCTGTAYMLVGASLATKLINALNRTDFYRSVNYRRLGEDIVFTALTAQIANIPRENTAGFANDHHMKYYCFAAEKRAFPLAVHYITSLRAINIIQQRMKVGRLC